MAQTASAKGSEVAEIGAAMPNCGNGLIQIF